MKLTGLGVGLMIAAGMLALVSAPEQAEACGGCFISESENTQVTGHRMVLSLSNTQSTLYDQISYSGSPESFAWILPIQGKVEIGLSSDLLFATLENQTQTTIVSPTINCSSSCFNGSGSGVGPGPGPGGSTGSGVEVIAQEVVGPYETVQLSASDPQALADWLATHGYVIPADVQAVVDSYVVDGFDFLAMRLVPGQGVDSMRPVRITSPGAGLTLPLRMVAAGTGATTAVTLWVVSEGRYQPQNFPSFVIEQQELVWDWDVSKSNYSALRQQRFDESDGFAWHLETAEPQSYGNFANLITVAEEEPLSSGYGDELGTGAVAEAAPDLNTLFAGITPSQLWISRMSAELSRPALTDDLVLSASPSQTPIARFYFVENTQGTPPECPPLPPGCEGGADSANSSGSGASDSGSSDGASSGCNATGEGSPKWSWLTLGALAVATLRRRRAARVRP
jgi:MYXO-CTERM domain-containing protein